MLLPTCISGAENPKRDQHEGQCACMSDPVLPYVLQGQILFIYTKYLVVQVVMHKLASYSLRY